MINNYSLSSIKYYRLRNCEKATYFAFKYSLNSNKYFEALSKYYLKFRMKEVKVLQKIVYTSTKQDLGDFIKNSCTF